MARWQKLDWLPDDDGIARRIGDHDWGATPLGPIASWPSALRTSLLLVLASPLPMVLVWGREFITLPNDACLVLLADGAAALAGPSSTSAAKSVISSHPNWRWRWSVDFH